MDPTLGVAMGVQGVYPSKWEIKVGSGPKISHRRIKNSISHSMVIWVWEPDAMLNKHLMRKEYYFGNISIQNNKFIPNFLIKTLFWHPQHEPGR